MQVKQSAFFAAAAVNAINIPGLHRGQCETLSAASTLSVI